MDFPVIQNEMKNNSYQESFLFFYKKSGFSSSLSLSDVWTYFFTPQLW